MKLKIDIRRNGPLARRSGAITAYDVYERADYPTSRSREFRDALTRSSDTPTPGVLTSALQWGRWTP
jgi:hypothetical protein